MNFESYEVGMAYPSSSAFKTKYWYKNGVLCWRQLPTDEKPVLMQTLGPKLEHCVVEVSTDDEAFKKARAEYARLEREAHERFKHDLFEELGIQFHPLREKLFSKAWEDGHSAGYREVLNCAHNLMDLLELPKGSVLVSKECVYWGGLGSPSAAATKLVTELQEKL